MKIRVPGEKTKVFCESCSQLGPGTWNYGTFVLKDGRSVDEVMLVKCDCCQSVVGMATQSAWRIEEARESQISPTSIRVSLPLQDLAASQVLSAGGEPKRGPELVTMAVLKILTNTPSGITDCARKARELKSPLLRGPNPIRMNLRLSQEYARTLSQLCEMAQLKQSEFVRRTLILAESEPQVRQVLAVR